VTRAARPFAYGLLGLLLVAGFVGFDAWPLTAWRLFSLSRDDTQRVWVLEAVDGGDTVGVDLEELPLAYRHAAWILDELPGASDERRTAVCDALLEAVEDVVPGADRLRILRDAQRLVVRDGGEVEVQHDAERFHECVGPGGDA
jgi:hypothetical protein